MIDRKIQISNVLIKGEWNQADFQPSLRNDERAITGEHAFPDVLRLWLPKTISLSEVSIPVSLKCLR